MLVYTNYVSECILLSYSVLVICLEFVICFFDFILRMARETTFDAVCMFECCKFVDHT